MARRTHTQHLAAAKELAAGPRTYRLRGKVAVVTGANSLTGIGRATALLYAREGVKHIYVADFDDSELGNLSQEIQKLYPDVKATAKQGDMSDEATVKALVDQVVVDEGRLDIFFANAGRAPLHMLPHTDAEESLDVLKVNTLSVLLALKYAGKAMQVTSSQKSHGGGAILATASVAGLRANAGPVDYSASKAAVVSMVQSGAYALLGTDVRVVGLAPGLIQTGMTEILFEMVKARGTEDKVGQVNPLQRYGAPEEVRMFADNREDTNAADRLLKQRFSSPQTRHHTSTA